MGIEVGPAHYTSMDGVESKGKKMVFFHEVVDEDKAASIREGRPIARTRIFVKHFTPGDTLLEVDKPMKPDDAMKYPEQWRAFQEKRSQVVNGTAIEMWPQISTTQVYEFKAMKIFTVEQLIGLPDQFAQKIQGFHQLKQKAENFLRLAKDATVLEEKNRQNEKLSAEIEELKRQVRELTSLAQAQPAVRRGGRPKGSKNKPKADAPSGQNSSPIS
jgi:hypothetical protein